MKVKELIKILERCNKNLDVMITDSEDNVLCDVSNVYRIITNEKNRIFCCDYAWTEQEYKNGTDDQWTTPKHNELLNSRQVIQLTFKSKIYNEQSENSNSCSYYSRL